MWTLLGNEFIWTETGEVNPVEQTFACANVHFGGPLGIRKGLKMLLSGTKGIKDIAELHSNLSKKIKITKSKSEYAMLQRTCFCLIGVAQQVGAGSGVVPTKQLRPAAERYLKAQQRKKAR